MMLCHKLPFVWTLFGFGVALTNDLTAQDQPDPGWMLTDLPAAEKMAAKSGKPLMLVFR